MRSSADAWLRAPMTSVAVRLTYFIVVSMLLSAPGWVLTRSASSGTFVRGLFVADSRCYHSSRNGSFSRSLEKMILDVVRERLSAPEHIQYILQRVEAAARSLSAMLCAEPPHHVVIDLDPQILGPSQAPADVAPLLCARRDANAPPQEQIA